MTVLVAEKVGQRLWATLVGPWSWSDLLDHLALGVAYGIARSPQRNQEELASEITELLRTRALYIVNEIEQEQKDRE